jgi:hypothetical protein
VVVSDAALKHLDDRTKARGAASIALTAAPLVSDVPVAWLKCRKSALAVGLDPSVGLDAAPGTPLSSRSARHLRELEERVAPR